MTAQIRIVNSWNQGEGYDEVELKPGVTIAKIKKALKKLIKPKK